MKVLIFFVSVLVLASCSSAPVPTNGVPPPNANAARTDGSPESGSLESNKAKEDVVASTRKLGELKFWSAKTVFEDLPTLNGEIKFVAPDRYYFKQGPNEAIAIGDQTYTKENGKWAKSDFDFVTGLRNIRENALTEEDVKKIGNAQMIGPEMLDGRKTLTYTHSVVSGPVESVTKLWIDEETRLVLKSVVENRRGKRIQRVVTTYDFDTPVRIDAPKIGS